MRLSVFIGDACQKVVSTAVMTPPCSALPREPRVGFKKLLWFNVTIPRPDVHRMCVTPGVSREIDFERKLPSSADEPRKITPRYSRGGGAWIRSWVVRRSLTLAPSSLMPRPPLADDNRYGVKRSQGRDGYIYTLKQEKGQPGRTWQANRQRWSGGAGDESQENWCMAVNE